MSRVMGDPRHFLTVAIQAKHDNDCYDYTCPCAGDEYKQWSNELQAYVSQVAIDEAEKWIAEIEKAAVERYREGVNR